jgi:hypothetical protein
MDRRITHWLEVINEAIERLPQPLRTLAGIGYVYFVIVPLSLLLWVGIAVAFRLVYLAFR